MPTQIKLTNLGRPMDISTDDGKTWTAILDIPEIKTDDDQKGKIVVKITNIYL